MCDTLSQMYSTVYLSVGSPTDDILSRLELGTIVMRQLSLRLEEVRQSEQAVNIIRSAEIAIGNTSDEYDLTTNIPDLVMPLWAEFKVLTVSNPLWAFLPTVHIATLPKERAVGRYACSFYGGNAREVKMQVSLYGNESGSPSNTVRVYYSPTISFPSNENEQIQLPDNLVNMVTLDAICAAIPLMQVNMMDLLAEQPELKAKAQALGGLLTTMREERDRFERRFTTWRKESRGSHRPSMANDVLTDVIGGYGVIPTVYRNGN